VPLGGIALPACWPHGNRHLAHTGVSPTRSSWVYATGWVRPWSRGRCAPMHHRRL